MNVAHPQWSVGNTSKAAERPDESRMATISIMWVNFSGDKMRAPNHLIPLIPCSGECCKVIESCFSYP